MENDEGKLSRINELMTQLGLNRSEMARKIGMNPTNFISVLNGKRACGDAVINKMVLSLGISKDWLLSGVGKMMQSNDEATVTTPNVFTVPFISKYAYAGYLHGYGDTEYLNYLPTRTFMVDDAQPHGKYISIEVNGDSMNDGSINSISDGDLLLCREINPMLYRDSKLHINKWLFVVITNDGILVKKITAHDVEHRTITLHSLNAMYEDIIMPLANVRSILNVVKFERKPIM